MTESTQSQFIALLEKAAEDYDRTLVVDYEFSNIGRAAFLKRGTLTVLFDFHFAFQTGMVTFEDLPINQAEEAVGTIVTSRAYAKNSELPAVLQRIRNALARLHQEDLEKELNTSTDQLRTLASGLGLTLDTRDKGRFSVAVDYAGNEPELNANALSLGLEIKVLHAHGPGGGWPELRITANPEDLLRWLKDYSTE